MLYEVITNDRTGIIALLLLALVGVAPEEMLADYELRTYPKIAMSARILAQAK